MPWSIPIFLRRRSNEDHATSDEHSFEGQFQPPPSSRDLDQLQYHISLQDIGKKLQIAANLAYPNDRRMRYSAVHVLLLRWEDEDPKLPVSFELEQLHSVFRDIYSFDVETWKIPSEGSHKRLNQKILDFVELGGDNKDELKIVYYGGHGFLAHNRQISWASRPVSKDPSFRTVKWSGIQHALEEAESDVLLLLDCCASGTANTDIGNGVTELLAACGFNTSANPVGPDSFTTALITELKLFSVAPSFTVGALYNKILCRMTNWMPTGREMQKPPLHVILTQNPLLPRSIQLSPLRTPLSIYSFPAPNTLGTTISLSTSSSTPQSSASDPSAQNSNISSDSSLSEKDQYPRIALTIRLKETLSASELSADLFTEWLRMMPVLAEQVKVEAGFSSFSTLLMVTLPVAIWCYLGSDPAITVEGLVQSPNLMRSSRRTPRRRIADLASEDRSKKPESPITEEKATPSGIITTPATQSPGESLGSFLAKPMPSPESDWKISGETYRKKIESLRNEVGQGWLSVLSEEGWDNRRNPASTTSNSSQNLASSASRSNPLGFHPHAVDRGQDANG